MSEILLPPPTRSFEDNVRVENLTIVGECANARWDSLVECDICGDAASVWKGALSTSRTCGSLGARLRFRLMSAGRDLRTPSLSGK